jgi:hypothetical protein
MMNAGASSIALLVLTAAHHYYGGIFYRSQFRFHVAMFGVAATFVLSIVLLLYRNRSASKSVLGSVLFWSLGFFVAVLAAVVGMSEGGYNHILKDLLYYSNASPHWMLKLFPPSHGFEAARNAAVETTGALQFFVGLLAFYYLFRSVRSKLLR